MRNQFSREASSKKLFADKSVYPTVTEILAKLEFLGFSDYVWSDLGDCWEITITQH
jgi:hypothetical protein